MMLAPLPRAAANRRLAWIVALAAAGSFAFAFALVPLYSTFCDLTGLNGATGIAAPAAMKEAAARWVTVEFTSTVMPGLPWRFEPVQRRVRVHPGEPVTAFYRATNLAPRAIDGQAVMSVMPETAATHLKKAECFCFERQALRSGETRDMPLIFFLTPDLPEDVNTVTLSYAFFPLGSGTH